MKDNVLTEKINNFALSSNGDKRMKSIDLIETYAYGTSKDLISEKEEIEYKNIINATKMIKFDDVKKKKKKK